MPTPYLVQPYDLLGSMEKVQAMQQNVQQLDLLGKQVENQTKDLAQKQKTEEFDQAYKMLTIPGQDESWYQPAADKLGAVFGIAPGTLNIGGREKEFIKEVTGLVEAKKKNPALDVQAPLLHLKQKYGTVKGAQGELDLVKGQMDTITKDTMQNYMSLLQGSGGFTKLPGTNQGDPRAQDLVMGQLATAGGSPDIRAAATEKIKATEALKPKAKEDYTLEGIRYSGATNKPIAGKEKGTGEFKESDYRGLLGQAASAAFRTLKFNNPGQLQILAAMLKSPDQSETLNAQLQNSMTPEQRDQYDKQVGVFMRKNVPREFLGELEERLNRVVVPGSGPGGSDVVIPKTIKTDRQAVEYLQRTYDMSEQEAVMWMRKNSEPAKK